MWQMIAEPGLDCSECRHTIHPGRLCLSELPEETPPGVSRKDFNNYCIGCPECWKQGKHACYVRHLSSGKSVGKTPRSLPCALCGRRIGSGERAGVDMYYEWPGETAETSGPRSLFRDIGAFTTAASVDTLIRGVPNGSFENLSETLQAKFKFAGGGVGREIRTMAEAQGFFFDSVPNPIRNLGELSINSYLKGKDASHIQSAQNAPHLVARNDNIIWEDSGVNRARGAENMTWKEEVFARGNNAFGASDIVFRECLTTAGITGFYSGLLEAPIATIENIIHYRKGRKTGEEALKDAATSIASRAVTGAAIGFAITGAVALLGAGPLLITIAPVLVPVGFALYGCSALKRILNAVEDGFPLNQVGTYFCSPRCHTTFAYETGKSALIRWEANRFASAA